MEKRGQSEVLTTTLLFELIIGVLIASALAYAVLNLNNTSRFSGEYMKRDFLLTNEMVKSLPGDIDLKYKTGNWCLNADGVFVKGQNCMVEITKTGDVVTAKRIEGKDEKRSV